MLSISRADSQSRQAPPPPPPDAKEFEDELGAGGEINEPPRRSLWDGLDGLMIMSLGFFVPATLITVSGVICFERIMRMTFKHPVETLIEAAFVSMIPFANYYAWKAIRRDEFRHPLRLGLMNGAAIATSFAAAIVIMASLCFGFPIGFAVLGLAAAAACACSIYLAIKLRDAGITRQSKSNRVLFSLVGVGLSLLGLVACETKGTIVRVSESMAMSDDAPTRDRGLDLLRHLDCEQDLRMQCADERTSGIPGLFWRIGPERERQLYFAVTGKPYGNSLTESVYSMSDEYLSKHVVGQPVKGLNLLRSAMTGYINTETLTSTVNWTFVFKNGTFENQEARAEIAVPPGAVISDLKLWAEGEPHRAFFGATDRLQGATYGGTVGNWVNFGVSDPAMITDLGRGRVLLKVAPVAAQKELKVQVTLTERLKPLPTKLAEASLTLPKFIDTNFALSGQHTMRLHAPQSSEMSVDVKGKVDTETAADGGDLLLASLKEEDLNGSPIAVKVKRQNFMGPYFIEDTISPMGGFIKETVREVATTAPEHLVVVVDNSQSMKENVDEVIAALQRIPQNVADKTTFVIPSQGDQSEPVSLQDGLRKLKTQKFDGGQDNLQAVIKAAEAAGETKHGAVLWIHGPQPNFNEEMYIMNPYIERPAFYELALDDRFTDTNEFFKNHREIGPFVPVTRGASIAEDLSLFVSKWKQGGKEFVVELVRSTDKPNCKPVTKEQAAELIKLCARDEAYAMLRQSNGAGAAELASACRLVTPVTGAFVLGQELQKPTYTNAAAEVTQTAWVQGGTNGTVTPQQYANHEAQQNTGSQTASGDAFESAPHLQGASNGTIGPQGTDATVITGVNTAGTVRVNNLANLEALLNIIANGCELGGLLFGAILLLPAFFGRGMDSPVKLRPFGRGAVGVALIVGALAIPGMINWMVASARDANLFS